MELNHNQQKFVAEFLIDGNGKQAAIRAGYAPKSAEVTASKLLRLAKVSEAIEAGQKAANAKAGLTVDLVRNRLRQIICFDVRKLYDDQGNLRPIQDLDDDTAAAVNGIEVQVERNRDEDSKVVTITRKVKSVDIARAVELGMRHFGLGKDVHEHTGKDGQPLVLELSSLDLARKIAFVLAVAKKDMDKAEG